MTVQIIDNPAPGVWYRSNEALPVDRLHVLTSDRDNQFRIDWIFDGQWRASGNNVSHPTYWQLPALPRPCMYDLLQ